MKFSSLLEEKMRNDPESYVEEFDSRLRYLTSLMETLRVSPKGVPEKDCSDLVALLTQVVRPLHGPDALKQLVDPIMVLLSTAHVHTLSSTMIQALVQGIISLRSKDLVPFSVSVPLFVQLLHLKDRHIRRTLLRTIAADISRLNNKGKQRTENRQLQTQMFGLVQQEDGMRSRYALSLMIDLYRRKVWNDSLCVHYISLAALNRESCTKRMALNFILGRAYRLGTVTALMEDDDAEEHHGNATDTGKRIAHLHKQFRVRKKNRGRERKLKNKVMSLSKEYGHNKGDEELNGTDAYHVLQPQQNPILFLRNPQQFAEDLFHQLQRTTEKFDMRLLMMTALARVIATHQLLLLDIYAYLQRYMEPYQREVTSIMALTVECTHNLVPPDVITPLLQTIANHFVTDRSSADAITVGLNTIREICKRSPTALPTDLLHDLIQYSSRHQRGTADAKGVIMAARSLLRFYRRVQPSLLPSRMRGRNHDLTKQMTPYGHFVPSTGVAGIELLSYPDTLDDHEEGSDKEESDDGEDSVCLSLEDTSQEGSGEEMEEEEEVDQGSGEEMEEEEEGSSEEMEEEEGSSEEMEEEEEEEEAPELIPVIPNSSGNKIPTTQITLNPSITPDDVMDRILTQEDFERIAKLRQRRDLSTHTGKDSKTVKKMLRGKRERDRKEDEVTETVDPETLELHSTKKQCRDKEERLKKIRESRERHTIQYRKSIKKGTKSNSEKRKGKLYQMSQRSQAVGKKIRRSQTQSQMALKEKKKRDVKFLIKRGYGA